MEGLAIHVSIREIDIASGSYDLAVLVRRVWQVLPAGNADQHCEKENHSFSHGHHFQNSAGHECQNSGFPHDVLVFTSLLRTP